MAKNKDVIYGVICDCGNRIKIRTSGAKKISDFQIKVVCRDCGKIHSFKSVDMIRKH